MPERTAARVRKAAGKEPVSAWVANVIEDRLRAAELEQQWQDFCRAAAPKQADIRHAGAIYDRLMGRSRGRGRRRVSVERI